MVETRSHRLHPMRTALPLGRRDRNGGGGSLLPPGLDRASGRLWWERWSPAGHGPQPVLWAPPAHRLAWGRVNRRVLRRRLVSASYLSLRLMTTTIGWMEPLTGSLMVVCGRGPVSTNGWTEPLTVTQWQPLDGGAHEHWSMAEQDH